ncbi:hypothetical protein [Kitasatospora sp. NPDC096140]|uniref:hypothetical protein n=1 Tax=Kitasatospora sp. NPDC096140 TaxID=3155425 RepID=UPI00332DE571
MSTSRPDSAPDPGADRTVVLGKHPAADGGTGGGAAVGEATVRLPRETEATVRLTGTPGGTGASAEGAESEGPDGGTGGGAAVGEATVRLPRETEATVRLTGTPGGTGAGAEEAESEPESATFLDPRVWGSEPRSGQTLTLTDSTRTEESTAPAAAQDAEAAPAVPPAPAVPADSAASAAAASSSSSGSATPAERPLASGEFRHFGPGVPPRAAAAWHGQTVPETGQPRPPRRVWRWLTPLLVVLLALAAFLFWRHLRPPALAVTGVTVTTDQANPGCAATAVVTAAVETNGGAGTLRYRWVRSDGTTSDEIVQDVRSGVHHTDLVLRWSFEGQGALQATATLQLLAPAPRTAATSFTYHCS